MKRTIPFLLFLLVLVGGSIVWILRPAAAPERPVATVTVAQTEVAVLPLDEDGTYTIAWPDGGSTTIELGLGRVRVLSADCPDQICVEQGWISDGVLPIVCLPHKMMITVAGGGDDLDVATK